MKRAPTAEPLVQLTSGEQFLIIHKRKFMLASFVIALVVTSVIQGGPGQVIGVQKGPQSSQVQTAHALGLALYVYARDHDGKYPRGNSSTEVFQQLMDEGYVTDAGIFYSSVAGTGKIKGTTNKLKPENVCWDITDAVGPDDSDELPLIFPTGYKIDYVAGGKAHLLSNGWRDGISVFYKNNSAAFCVAQSGGVPIIDATFDPKGKTYRQLTPDGHCHECKRAHRIGRIDSQEHCKLS